MENTAILLANGYYRTVYAKTSHGLVRGPSRFPIAAVVDATCAGQDAGILLDGRHRDIPIVASLAEAITHGASTGAAPGHCIVGVANPGGVLPPDLRADLVTAAEAGMSLVNGLHQLLSDDPEFVDLAGRHGGGLVDIRKPPPTSELRFWSGEILDLQVPRVAVLGTDCALGKRTTSSLLHRALRDDGVRAEMIYTGQTGWLQGYPHGFIFDATPNDFVCGELEGALLACARDTDPQVILIEGQSSLRNPSGPCGAEFLLSGGAKGVILLHAPGRRCFEGLEEAGCEIGGVAREIELIRLYGSEVLGIGIHTEGLSDEEAEAHRARLEADTGLPTVLPLRDGVDRLAAAVADHCGLGDPGGSSRS
ncbi:MAG: DUF1611 domain-containing protein [Acidobacteriota bacterium]